MISNAIHLSALWTDLINFARIYTIVGLVFLPKSLGDLLLNIVLLGGRFVDKRIDFIKRRRKLFYGLFLRNTVHAVHLQRDQCFLLLVQVETTQISTG